MDSAIKFFEHDFTGRTIKEAYLKACKWVAKFVISKAEISETLVKYEKVVGGDLPTCKMALYALYNDSDFLKTTCNSCKEFHSLFYINQQFNCECCNLTAYRKQLEIKLENKKSYRKERLRYIVNKQREMRDE